MIEHCIVQFLVAFVITGVICLVVKGLMKK